MEFTPRRTRHSLGPASRNRWLFSPLPFLSTPREYPWSSEIEREIERRGCSVERLPSLLLPSIRTRRERRSAERCSAEVMNLQIPWNGACCSLVAAVASARNRTPISLLLSLSVLDFQRSLPPPARLRNGNCVCEERERRARPVLQSNGGSAEKLLLGQLYFNQFKGCSGLNGN